MTKTIKDFCALDGPHDFKYNSKLLPDFGAVDPQLLYGVELEIEHARGWEVNGFYFKADGSLRENGLEFISQPMTLQNLHYGLQEFFRLTKVTDNNYSERCSTHVHTNVCDLTWDQLGTICLLYQIFEKLLFAYVGEDRDKNIFCVPWSETILNYKIINKIKESHRELRNWYKYTALNLRTIHTIGTIEWRHLGGCHDLTKIMNWCQLIGSIYKWARNNSLEDTEKFVINLNSTSEYRSTLDTIFGSYADYLRINNYTELLEDGVLNMKYGLIGKNDKPVGFAERMLHHNIELAISILNGTYANMRNVGEEDIAWAQNVLTERGLNPPNIVREIPEPPQQARIEPVQLQGNWVMWQDGDDPIINNTTATDLYFVRRPI